ncbi:MAG: hypothetical protein CR978_00080 [Gammaproteobacteria bacterium]|nr:MAG: hypothetical protein CR978_00080 [Gammaproteobacteria bacterium]
MQKLLIVLFALLSLTADAQAPRPNIIHILADDLGYGELGAFGQKKIRTPHIDQLAREGLRLDRHYAGSALCSPSRYAFMTGRHAGSTGVSGNGYNVLPKNTITVARLLQQAGYYTIFAGKWALGVPGSSGDPLKQGFDQWYGYSNQGDAHDYYPEHLYENGRRVKLPGNQTSKRARVAKAAVTYAPLSIESWALATLAQQHRRAPQQPIYLQFDVTLPHLNNELAAIDGVGAQYPGPARYRGEAWPEEMRGYAEMVSQLDDSLGRLVAMLKQQGMADNTVLIFSSDNGPTGVRGLANLGFFQASGALKGLKGMALEGGIRVPTVVWWPGHIKAGGQSESPSAFWDMLPTFAALAGVKSPASDGVSQLPLWLEGKPPKREKPLYWRMKNWRAVMDGDYKWLRFDGDGSSVERLYDVRNDPGEKQDLKNQKPAVFKRLRASAQHEEDKEKR